MVYIEVIGFDAKPSPETIRQTFLPEFEIQLVYIEVIEFDAKPSPETIRQTFWTEFEIQLVYIVVIELGTEWIDVVYQKKPQFGFECFMIALIFVLAQVGRITARKTMLI
ncbi:hypothetical protein RDG75_004155 [Vibrio alginolyticus]|nr:hypothetical protein [Vibrio alginolyticus]